MKLLTLLYHHVFEFNSMKLLIATSLLVASICGLAHGSGALRNNDKESEQGDRDLFKFVAYCKNNDAWYGGIDTGCQSGTQCKTASGQEPCAWCPGTQCVGVGGGGGPTCINDGPWNGGINTGCKAKELCVGEGYQKIGAHVEGKHCMAYQCTNTNDDSHGGYDEGCDLKHPVCVNEKDGGQIDAYCYGKCARCVNSFVTDDDPRADFGCPASAPRCVKYDGTNPDVWSAGDTCIGSNPTCYPKDCDDGDACTDDYCSYGKCHHTAKDCNDGNDCTADYCCNGICQYFDFCNPTCEYK
jgi:hypothetical protein